MVGLGNIHAPLVRMRAIADVDELASAALFAALAKRIVIKRGNPLPNTNGEAYVVASGWGALTRKRLEQPAMALSLALPGDILPYAPRTNTVYTALTDMVIFLAPDASMSPTLAAAYARSREIDTLLLEAQIARVGYTPAFERIRDWFVEVHARLSLAGCVVGNQVSVPLPQTLQGELLALTPVHINRMRRALVEAGACVLGRGHAELGPQMMVQSAALVEHLSARRLVRPVAA